ncbi:MAG: hypothetical protein KIT33_02240 [Candidatus Kapabacteria bacterium]|nr:hypothetical protein [Ignavibacteriota bacterium]MCW5883769.1 hypothetical protein [Candidatus Kapabacteria bacterium]
MENLKVSARFIIAGFLLAFLLSFLTHCPESNPSGPINEDPAVETPDIKQFSNDVIAAFESQNPDVVLNLMYDEYKEFHSEGLKATAEKMQTFAEALKNRKIIFSSELYAEYEVTIDGEVFTIAYSNYGDGNWMLHRF